MVDPSGRVSFLSCPSESSVRQAFWLLTSTVAHFDTAAGFTAPTVVLLVRCTRSSLALWQQKPKHLLRTSELERDGFPPWFPQLKPRTKANQGEAWVGTSPSILKSFLSKGLDKNQAIQLGILLWSHPRSTLSILAEKSLSPRSCTASLSGFVHFVVPFMVLEYGIPIARNSFHQY